jgi:tetratricopeptide (TPR) repeat protein
VQHAIDLDPGLMWAHYTMAGIDLTENDWASGVAEINRMREIDPNDQTLLPKVEADVYRVWCRFPEAIQRSQEIADRDPLDTYGWADLAWAEYGAGQYENSIDSLRHLIALAPNFAGAHADIGSAFERLGRYSEALAEAEKEVDDASRLEALSKIYWAQGNHTRSDELLKELIKRQGSDALSIASLHAYRGENSAALDWLEKAYERHETVIDIKCSRSWEKLRDEPRYQAMLEKIHMKDMPPLP